MGNKAVFLDRDGVLNWTRVEKGKPYAPTKFEDFKLLPEALEATRSLKAQGYLLIVVTNQPDVGNGLVAQSEVDQMNCHLCDQLPIDQVKVCFHSQQAGCECRKPKPGMLLEAIKQFEIDPTQSFMIGDRWGDVQAGNAAGCRTIFLERGYAESIKDKAEFLCEDLSEAAAYILNSTRTETV